MRVRREHVIGALAGGAVVLEAQRERAAAAAPSGSALAAGEKPSEARQHGRRELVAASFHLASLSILGQPARLAGITLEAASHP